MIAIVSAGSNSSSSPDRNFTKKSSGTMSPRRDAGVSPFVAEPSTKEDWSLSFEEGNV